MIKKPLPSRVGGALAQLPIDSMDIFLLENATVRATILHGTRMVNEMRINHNLGILETLGLGYAYMGAGLCTNQMKGEDKLFLTMDCDGPMHGFSVSCDASGHVRGYLKTDHIELDSAPSSFDLAPYIGQGSLSVTKWLDGAREPFTGTIDLVHKSVARDLTRYFLESEQIHTAISMSIFFDTDGLVRGAGALFLQALPGADDLTLEDLEDWLHEIPSIGKDLAGGLPPTRLVLDRFAAFGPELVGSRDIEFLCDCESSRFSNYLRTLPKDEKQALREIDAETVEVRCHNCGTVYRYSHEEIL